MCQKGQFDTPPPLFSNKKTNKLINFLSDLLLNLITESNAQINYFDSDVLMADSDNAQYVDSVNGKQLQFSKQFAPLFDKVHELEEIGKKSYDNVQVNKIMYEVLNQCVINVGNEVRNIRSRKSRLDNFVIFKNYVYFENLRFIQNLNSGISLELLKDEYFKLLEEYNKSMSSLGFTIPEDDQFIQALQHNFKGRDESMFDIISQISDDIQNSGYKCGHNKRYSLCGSNSSQNYTHPALLKILKSLMNMSEFYGIIQDESNSGLIFNERSEYGNLRMFYTKHSNLDNLTKSKIALDICNGLVFLNEMNFLHRNIRYENILITSDFRAKIINFDHGRLAKEDSKQLEIYCTRIEYVAPEIIGRNTRTYTDPSISASTSRVRYNFKCEIYSFGILLWELANQKPPSPYKYENKLDKIVNFVRKNKNNFDSSIPNQFKNISTKATNNDPENRPSIRDMHKVLYNLVNDLNCNP
ncbi:kinase-like domain-containing protein [Gigaspora rosea]|uniref:Kinase-like domain-containing protein n=1 Tax=Gigaspora rosea TaxID=44941 RepID=A0A397UW91_9GLOM|nr:kinase-like domain-containing protein [Gigaspora rosea]